MTVNCPHLSRQKIVVVVVSGLKIEKYFGSQAALDGEDLDALDAFEEVIDNVNHSAETERPELDDRAPATLVQDHDDSDITTYSNASTVRVDDLSVSFQVGYLGAKANQIFSN